MLDQVRFGELSLMFINTMKMRGFSLIEAMVVVAILAIMASMAAPSMQQMLANSRVQTAAEGLLTGLQLARTEAIRRNSNVAFCSGASGAWEIFLGADCEGTPIQSRPTNESPNLTIAADPDDVVFNPLGRAGAAMVVNVSSSVAGTRSRRVTVNVGGQVRMCDPGLTTANDPRGC